MCALLLPPCQLLATDENFIIFAGDSLVATAASAACLQMMGKSAAQLSSGTVTLAEYFPQLPYLIQSAAADHDDFQSLVTLSPDDELPALDDAGNRSMIMCPGSDTYSRQLSMGGTDRVYHENQGGGGRLGGFAVQARVQILGFPSSMIKAKQRRGGGRRGRQGAGEPEEAAVAINGSARVARVCILRWRLSSDATAEYAVVEQPRTSLSPPEEGEARESSPDYHQHHVRKKEAKPPAKPQPATRTNLDDDDLRRRYSTTDNLLAGILESDSEYPRNEESPAPRVTFQHHDDGHARPGRGSGDSSTGISDHDDGDRSMSSSPTSARAEAEEGFLEETKRHGEGPHPAPKPMVGGETINTEGVITLGSVHSYKETQQGAGNLISSNDDHDDDHDDHDGRGKGVHWDSNNPKRGARSVDTGGTGSTASSGLSVLRSHLDGTQRRVMEPALKALRNTVVLVLGLACALAIASAVVNASLLQSFESAGTTVETSGNRLYFGSDTALHVLELSMLWSKALSGDDAKFKQSQADLEEVAINLEEQHKSLYLSANEEEVSVLVVLIGPEQQFMPP